MSPAPVVVVVSPVDGRGPGIVGFGGSVSDQPDRFPMVAEIIFHAVAEVPPVP